MKPVARTPIVMEIRGGRREKVAKIRR